MKIIFTILVLAAGLSLGALAQQPKQLPGEHYASTDLSITGTYKIKEDQMIVVCTLGNKSESGYKEVVYSIKCLDENGKVLQSANYTWEDPIGAGATQQQKKMTFDCKVGTKTLAFAIVDGTKIVDNKNTKKKK